jgi:hypothetical protein
MKRRRLLRLVIYHARNQYPDRKHIARGLREQWRYYQAHPDADYRWQRFLHHYWELQSQH